MREWLFRGIPGLYPLEASSTLQTHCDNKVYPVCAVCCSECSGIPELSFSFDVGVKRQTIGCQIQCKVCSVCVYVCVLGGMRGKGERIRENFLSEVALNEDLTRR